MLNNCFVSGSEPISCRVIGCGDIWAKDGTDAAEIGVSLANYGGILG